MSDDFNQQPKIDLIEMPERWSIRDLPAKRAAAFSAIFIIAIFAIAAILETFTVFAGIVEGVLTQFGLLPPDFGP